MIKKPLISKWINKAAITHRKIRLMQQAPKDEVQNPQMRQTIFTFVVKKKKENTGFAYPPTTPTWCPAPKPISWMKMGA